ncbi:hypothetical protein GCM10027429_13380 [Marivirga atlantica]|jgi:HEAT repeat protein|uniref:Uncharacterized protein n=1 Tax=Marivirga atlantica TaxID=1548457 RepID=A0A937ALL7_9BACT|nr:hypothetical protein [Marivirga atlantica]MBL0764952.1 hypothetical protein [Marivirga atlantica]
MNLILKFSHHQFTEIAFIIENSNGYSHSAYEKSVIEESELTIYKPAELVQFIISGLESELYEKETDRIAAYWALSKTFDKNLIPNLKSWLKSELENEKSTAVFQILIALDRLDEPVFPGNRTGQAYNEVELNYKYAKNYLKIK